MSDIVRLRVPPFAPTSPTSLSALRRPLVQQQHMSCGAECHPCPDCVAAHQADLEAARKLSADLGLRLSRLVEDAVATHVARLEAQQTQLVQSVLTAVLPHLADANLRSALMDVLTEALDPLKDVTVHLTKHPDLDLGDLPIEGRLQIEDSASHPRDSLSLRDGDSLTTIDAGPLIEACLSRLNGDDSPTSAGVTTP